jgi:tryptophan-rich sensory protein
LILLGLKVSILGVILLIPYLMWIFYAFILNLLIYIKN